MKWQVVGSDGFVYAQFAYGVDALQYKVKSPQSFISDLSIEKIGEQ